MTTYEMQQEILRLKKEKGVCILAHAYQSHDLWDIADYVGDSFGLSVQASKAKEDTVILCGVRFMAETVKILSPQKRVFLANPGAGCPMAEQLDKDLLIELKKTYPGYTVACYINTTSDLKTECDICVTSSSAKTVLSRVENDKILFVPDCNLGDYISRQLPEKTFAFVHGGCPTHLRITKKHVEKARAEHPTALFLVHPECHPTVTAMADFVGSTTQILSYAEKSDAKEFIIGTENSIVSHLQFACPDKRFFAVNGDTVCHNMKLTTLGDVLACLKGVGGDEIRLEEDTRLKAKKCIDEMLRLGAQ